MANPLVKKYRPKKLADVVGQEVVVRILENSWKSQNWHHAYVLQGSKGLGKTSIARIMAAMENCEKGPTLEPCGECQNCREIFEGKSLDVREIDAASNRSIDNIRALQDEIQYFPIRCRKKYVIIDEGHGLTGTAADATLKMIEEPPDHVRFVLATTEPEAFKSTIPSRCINLTFSKVGMSELQNHLKNIAQKEKINISDDALRVVAKSSQGSVRNSLQNLQMVIDYAGGKDITSEMAQKTLGETDDALHFELVKNIFEVKTPEAIKIVENLLLVSPNADKLISDLMMYLRNLMVYILCGQDASVLDLTEEDIKRYQFQAKTISVSTLPDMIEMLHKLHRDMNLNIDAQALLDAFVVKSVIIAVKNKQKSSENK